MSRKTKHLRQAAEALEAGHPLSEETARLLASVLTGEADIRDTQPAGFYEAPFDAFAIKILAEVSA